MNDAIFLKTGRFQRKCLSLIATLLFASALLTASPWDHVQSGAPANAALEINSQDLKRMLSIAETRLDVVKALIAQGKFERVQPEMKIIFQLDLPDMYEGQVTEAALIVSKLLVDKAQFEIAHGVLDMAFLRVKTNANKATLLKLKAGIYKQEGKLDKAVVTWEQALALEKIQPGQ